MKPGPSRPVSESDTRHFRRRASPNHNLSLAAAVALNSSQQLHRRSEGQTGRGMPLLHAEQPPVRADRVRRAGPGRAPRGHVRNRAVGRLLPRLFINREHAELACRRRGGDPPAGSHSPHMKLAIHDTRQDR